MKKRNAKARRAPLGGIFLLGAIVLGAALLMFGAPHIVHKPKPLPGPPPPACRPIPSRPDTTVLRLRPGNVIIIKAVAR